MAETDLVTYQDAVEDLLDYFGEGHDRRAKRTAKRAVLEAYRFITRRSHWTIYSGLDRISTVAPYETGTIAYDHTGGSSERLLTLTSGTFPTWSEYGVVTISDRPYHVESYIDSTHLTLTEALNPGADVASGTSYTLHRDTYYLPVAARSIGGLRDVVDGYCPIYVDPERWLEATRGFTSQGCPTYYTIIGEPEHYNSLAVRFAPSPDAVYVYDYILERAPTPLRTLDDASGTVAVSGTTVTASAAVFKSWHVGCVLRTGDTTNEPTGFQGEHPYQYQRIITAVTDTTTATIDATIAATITADKYTLSDPLDIDTGSMLDAFMAECRARFARMLSRQDAPKLKTEAREAYILAKGMDNKSDQLGTFGFGPAGGLPTPRPFSVTGD